MTRRVRPVTDSRLQQWARLALERLEDRTTPTNFVVTNTGDAGPGSLRQAVLEANASPGLDTITFDSAVEGTITLTSGVMTITDRLTILGSTSSRVTVSGNNQSGIF